MKEIELKLVPEKGACVITKLINSGLQFDQQKNTGLQFKHEARQGATDLELQAMFPSCISNCLDSAMVWVTTSVKSNLCDSFLQTGLCNEFSNPFGYFLKPWI